MLGQLPLSSQPPSLCSLQAGPRPWSLWFRKGEKLCLHGLQNKHRVASVQTSPDAVTKEDHVLGEASWEWKGKVPQSRRRVTGEKVSKGFCTISKTKKRQRVREKTGFISEVIFIASLLSSEISSEALTSIQRLWEAEIAYFPLNRREINDNSHWSIPLSRQEEAAVKLIPYALQASLLQPRGREG